MLLQIEVPPANQPMNMHLIAALVGFLIIEVAEAATNGTVLLSFQGGSGPGYKPCPDTTGAVGPNHVADFEDSWFMVYEKPPRFCDRALGP
jgi:hypothetical protein